MTSFCLDNTFVSHYLDGRQYTKEFLEPYVEEPDVNFYLPYLVEYEAAVPAFQQGGRREFEQVKQKLSAFQKVPFSESHVEEAAQIRAHLIDNGKKIGAPDVLIAGVARNMDSKVVTSNSDHFSRVPNLTVINPSSD